MNQETTAAAEAAATEATAAKLDVTSFHFKATKDVKVVPTGKDEAGNYVFDEAGQALVKSGWKYVADDKGVAKGWKRPSVDVVLPQVTEEDVINALDKGGQVKQFLFSITNDQFYNAARAKINALLGDNILATISADVIKTFDLTLESIASAYLEEAAASRATGIAKEVWDDFMLDYVTVMTRELPENGEEKIKNAAEHLKLRFAKCRSNKKMLAKLQGYLALWFTATSRQEEFAKLFQNLDDRAKVLLATDDEDSI